MSRLAIAQIINSSIQEINVSYSAVSSISAVFITHPNQMNAASKRRLLSADSPITGQLTKFAAVTAAAAGILTSMHANPPAFQSHTTPKLQSSTLILQDNKQNPPDSLEIRHSAKPFTANRTSSQSELPNQDITGMIELTHERHHLLATSLRSETVQLKPKESIHEVKIEPPVAKSEEIPGFADLIVAEALQYRGVPFVWGGTQPSGFDCSGFVQYVFKRLGIQIPRMSYDQAEIGVPISRVQLEKGDLVFFQTDQAGASHIGIYLGDHQFVHADASRGITVSSLTNSYWNSRYYTARRLHK